ncbi:7249_t:CDS:2 [Paraglomus occultum]|uniref:Small RNA 2'-O-methyltransferase n=1 Tax=Paraglomus occultum TaxID=144539 RepID=A0A9N9H240_9GLOM|nr:7249_t:CDS:2 [Paraglomus occultum]
MSNEEVGESGIIVFDPPLWKQRRALVNDTLRKERVTSAIDFGCGEGQILSLLTYPYDEYPITRLAGVDIDEEALNIARERCQPDELDINISPLTVDIYQGSIDVADKRLMGYEAVICMEVIEHVDPPVLDKFFDVVLGTYKPRILIVSTPNAEFNVYFPQLKYGTPEAKFRIDDHRFEWTRKEFADWCNAGALKYNYSVNFTGVGVLPYCDPAVGTSTQIAIFRDLSPTSKSINSTFGTYKHLEQIVHPHLDEPMKSNAEILDKIHYFMKYIINPIGGKGSNEAIISGVNENGVNEDGVNENGVITYIDNATDGMSTINSARNNTTHVNFSSSHQPKVVKLDDLWNIQEIWLLCRKKNKLREVLLSSPSEFSFLNDDSVLVYKEYPPDEVEEEEEYVPYSETASSPWNGDTKDVYSVDYDGNDENIDSNDGCEWKHFSIEESADIGWD